MARPGVRLRRGDAARHAQRRDARADDVSRPAHHDGPGRDILGHGQPARCRHGDHGRVRLPRRRRRASRPRARRRGRHRASAARRAVWPHLHRARPRRASLVLHHTPRLSAPGLSAVGVGGWQAGFRRAAPEAQALTRSRSLCGCPAWPHRQAGGKAVLHPAATPERLTLFSDGVFAVLITVLVLDLRPPELPTFRALLSLWPTALSYAVSYLFVAIVWTNHHHLLHHATVATPRLIWFNFAHLFSVSLLPLSTAWMAVSELAPQPVAFYAAVFFLVNTTYVLLIWELIDARRPDGVSRRVSRIMRARSIATLCLFGAAAVVALKYPLVGLGICCCCLIAYLRPGVAGTERHPAERHPADAKGHNPGHRS
ncbi:MAG: DUF1211 domain-containing protein [Alphaproteobacteria bacterium]|nr:DUF1211 domain-containing protein [Alphaproteobacteria bacterium]